MAAGLVMAVLAACTATSSTGEPDVPPDQPRSHPLAFTEGITSPYGGGPEGAVITMELHNFGTDTLTIRRITGFVSDPGLRPEYIGWTNCRGGCRVGGPWDGAAQETVFGGLEGTVPVVVFVLRLDNGDPAAANLQHKCLYLRAIEVEVDHGETQRVGYRGAGPIGGVELPAPFPPGYQPCQLGKD
ncbi:MAG TPA: hypothetical protein VM390_03685 [Acidimicrobiales bacterium]|nr:hypothetical protein [Acidimicrobiales bacterium]